MEKIKEVASKIGKLGLSWSQKAQAKLDDLTKPQGSLGRLEELAKQIVSIKCDINPKIGKKAIIVMAADHGVVDEGVSAYPKEVTTQMVYNFLSGGAAINVLARHIEADVFVVDIGVAADFKENSSLIQKKIDYGTKNMAKGAAMTKEQAIKSLEAGIEVAKNMIEKGYDILATGDMGIGNTTASSAVASVICKTDVGDVTGLGTGIDKKGLENKINIIKKAISLNNPDACDGIDVLSKVGGFEIGGIAGIILGCAACKVPVVIDGFISGAGALIAYTIAPDSVNYMIPSHSSVERGHKIILDKLGIKALLDFDMRLGEGTGAALGISIVEASVKILNEMATFSRAGVSEKNE
jgi:nicotinate-nucleotide--dimethylbenzimidazole phosphoribosyltransferase